MHTQSKGFTLIELLTTLTLILIGTMIALPAFQGMINHHTRTQSTNELLGLIHFARYTAILERSHVTVCPVIMGKCLKSHVWSGELMAFNDQNKNGQHDENEGIFRNIQLASNINWQWWNFRRRTYLQFSPNGQPNALNGTVTLCQHGLQTQKIIINVLGRPRTERLPSTAPCS